MAYSVDFRKRVVNAVLNGKKIKEISESLAVHSNTISNWMKTYYEEQRLSPKPYYRKPYKVDWDALIKFVKLNPDLDQREYAKKFGITQGQVCKILQKYGITYKKNTDVLRAG